MAVSGEQTAERGYDLVMRMRDVAIVAVLAGCGTDAPEDPHQVVQCSTGECELACIDYSFGSDRHPCDAHNDVGVTLGNGAFVGDFSCPATILYRPTGERGCCLPGDGNGDVRRFFVCVE